LLFQVVVIGVRVLNRVVQYGRHQGALVRDAEDVADDEADAERVADVGRLPVLAQLVPVGAGGEGH
jgi:hypothetical protein